MSNKSKKRLKGALRNVVLSHVFTLVVIIGMATAYYPMISDSVNERNQSRVIQSYIEKAAVLPIADHNRLFDEAREYNRRLAELPAPLYTPDEVPGYESLLNFYGNGIMGFVSIPKINVKLPVYHGTNSTVLTSAIGHLYGSSLPVGGKNVHSVIMAHRGLPSAKLFTDLDRMEIGDRFVVTVLDDHFIYEVDQIKTVLPDETEELELIPGEDHVTLQTCTPYGINSHRLLVRAKRVNFGYSRQLERSIAEQMIEEVDTGTVQKNTKKTLIIVLPTAAFAVFAIVVNSANIKIYRKERRRHVEKSDTES